MRKEFEMTEDQAKKWIEDSKPSPLLDPRTGIPMEMPQDAANKAWKNLGKELGFIWHTVQAVPGKAKRFFTAEVADEGEKT